MSAAPEHVFISHSTKDDDVVERLRQALDDQGVQVWTDARELTAGDALEDEIRRAIAEARSVVVVVSLPAFQSGWVKKEIAHALAVSETRDASYKVIPLLIDPVIPEMLPALFPKEPVALPLEIAPGGLSEALPGLLAALGLRAPEQPRTRPQPEAQPIADLVLELEDPRVEQVEKGKHRALATARLTYKPPGSGEREVESKRFPFTAPLGPIELGDLAWYLESYSDWPGKIFRDRVEGIETSLPEWGRALYDALRTEAAHEPLEAWRHLPTDTARRFSIEVDEDLPEGSDEQRVAQARQGATLLLALPWELVHDGKGYLFQGARPVRVRRQLPSRDLQPPLVTEPPLRVLMLSPRPEEEGVGYIDHRVSARPLVEALAPLGELVEFKLLTPPTLPALQEELTRAREAATPYHVVHFDGHGVYDRHKGLGALCFEDPRDAEKPGKRRMERIDAERFAGVVRDHRSPLVFLEACQTAMTETEPMASVAGRLLAQGVASVVAMSHAVLVETARRFVGVFYRELMQGKRVGEAMLAGQIALAVDPFRLKTFAGDLHLQDWFVPVLFQEEQDPQLLTRLPAEQVTEVEAERRKKVLAGLPEPPPHTFVGRSRELLEAERLLEHERWVVLRGEGGEGKTTLGCELARWLVQTRRFHRAAFVSFEEHTEARSMLFKLGEDLVPGFVTQAATDFEKGVQLVERALRERPTVVVLDNVETVLPPAGEAPGAQLFEPEVLQAILALCKRLGEAGKTRLVFTSRERLPAPFDAPARSVEIGRLSRREAIELVGRVLGKEGGAPEEDVDEEDVEALVDAVNRHARSLVLLAKEVGASGVRHAAENAAGVMAELAKRYPDDRERSLFASVELSLRRLPAGMRERIRKLAVFEGGGHLGVIAAVLGLETDKDEEIALAQQLQAVGLAEPFPYGHLRFHPALGPALARELSTEEREEARNAWAAATAELAAFLYQQQFKDPQLAATLTLLDLPNLLAALEHLQGEASAEQVVDLATDLESLLANLGRPKALARVVRVREAAAAALGEWSHARYLAESAAVDRLLDTGRFGEAVAAAQRLVEQTRAAGEEGYDEVAYDLAMAHFSLGRALQRSGGAGAALAPLQEARERFERLAETGNERAARMASVCLTETADCLQDLGRLDEAAAAYQTAIERAEQRDDPRSVAIGTLQLGTVRLLQRRYPEALAAYEEVRKIFERLGEPGPVATAWHQIGMVHQRAGRFDQAERAYRQSLKILVDRGDRAGEASSLNQLGNLYDSMGRLEEAVRFYREAAAIRQESGDLAKEGRARGNAADTLVKLGRHAESRREILRAIECDKPFGHAAEPWKAFHVLHDLERAEGNQAAAAQAREQAIEAFLAYRRDGGENLTGGKTAQLCGAVAQAIADGQFQTLVQQLDEVANSPDLPSSLKSVIPALRAILAGSRDPSLAADPELDYTDAAELRLLLEGLVGPR